MAKRDNRSGQAWLERTNPLQGLSIRDAQSIFDAARGGDTQRLHWLFQEIEAANPVLLTCVERRASALAGMPWKVDARASAKDQTLADEQRDAVDGFLSGIENLAEAFEHLDLAFFRGFSHVQPIWEADGTVRTVNLPDSWLFVRDPATQEWSVNPECTGFADGLQSCADARLVTVTRRRPIDYPALGIHVRHAVGERDWGRFLERHALPKPVLTMHQGATEEQKGDYVRAAQAIENGQVATLPWSAGIQDFAGGSRGTDPFSTFVDHQERLVVLLSTGGTLTSLAMADTGSLAGGAQMKVWREIVSRDATLIAAAVNRSMVRPFLEAAFPGRPVCVDFAFETSEPPTALETAQVAATLKSAGYTVDQSELEEKVGLKLERDATPAPGAFGLARAKDQGKKPAAQVADPLEEALMLKMAEAMAEELGKGQNDE